jgi:hypothetical protein
LEAAKPADLDAVAIWTGASRVNGLRRDPKRKKVADPSGNFLWRFGWKPR